MYQVVILEQVENQIKKLDRSVQERIFATLERIKIRPQDFLEKLVGEKGYKLRVGDYRLFIDILEDKLVLLVIEFGHRKNSSKK